MMLPTLIVFEAARNGHGDHNITPPESAAQFYFFLIRLHKKQVVLLGFERELATVVAEADLALDPAGEVGGGDGWR